MVWKSIYFYLPLLYACVLFKCRSIDPSGFYRKRIWFSYSISSPLLDIRLFAPTSNLNKETFLGVNYVPHVTRLMDNKVLPSWLATLHVIQPPRDLSHLGPESPWPRVIPEVRHT